MDIYSLAIAHFQRHRRPRLADPRSEDQFYAQRAGQPPMRQSSLQWCGVAAVVFAILAILPF